MSHREAGPDDPVLADLLKAAGPRDEPPAGFAQELKAVLHAEWQATVRERQRIRRRWKATGAVAAAAVVAAVGLGLWRSVPDSEPVATVVQASGDVAAPAALAPGDRVVTGADGRAALAFASGISLRVAADSELAVEDATHVTMRRGTVYVDAGMDGKDRPLLLSTPQGELRHLGTQYQARLLDDAIEVSVREGRIELRRDGGALQGVAGERLHVSATGDVSRIPMARDAAEWQWASAIAPTFDIENRPLTEFLLWAGRETGRDIVFASPSSQAAAAAVVLRGSVAGLTPDQAIDAVLATTTLRAERTPGQVLIRD